jgi:hypothetical protein
MLSRILCLSHSFARICHESFIRAHLSRIIHSRASVTPLQEGSAMHLIIPDEQPHEEEPTPARMS